jgi:hypothetical protein
MGDYFSIHQELQMVVVINSWIALVLIENQGIKNYPFMNRQLLKAH